ncbi:hypothetical protein EVAR_69967_1 [Eumeta japonica]|uniref:Uncharacterized protein n=1 Tax=Eumeta variegata TaxID=151549 RepID=A0A4C1TPM9_EUMVA|nr:hypothetical protein EVAR_69967_1 [Eumeta japonica]
MQSPVLSTTTIEVYSLIHQHKHIDYTQRLMIASNRNHAINNLSSGSNSNPSKEDSTSPTTTSILISNKELTKLKRDEINSTRAEYDEDEDNKVAFLD